MSVPLACSNSLGRDLGFPVCTGKLRTLLMPDQILATTSMQLGRRRAAYSRTTMSGLLSRSSWSPSISAQVEADPRLVVCIALGSRRERTRTNQSGVQIQPLFPSDRVSHFIIAWCLSFSVILVLLHSGNPRALLGNDGWCPQAPIFYHNWREAPINNLSVPPIASAMLRCSNDNGGECSNDNGGEFRRGPYSSSSVFCAAGIVRRPVYVVVEA